MIGHRGSACRSAPFGACAFLLLLGLSVTAACSDADKEKAPRKAKVVAVVGKDREAQDVRARWGNPQRDGVVDEVRLPPALRHTYYVWPEAAEGGDGSEDRPWSDLQAALGELGPGDRLVMLPGRYRVSVLIDEPCRDGLPEAPIEVLARVNAVLSGSGEGAPVVEVRRAFWHFYGLEISPGNLKVPAFATYGKGATGILLDQSHLRDGRGDGVVIGPYSRDIVISGTHIHHFGHEKWAPDAYGVKVLPGAGAVRIAGNNIHNNFSGPYVVIPPERHPADRDGRPLAAAEDIVLEDNEMQKNW